MNRPQKIALLAKLLAGRANAKHIRDILPDQPVFGIIRPNKDGTHPIVGPDTEVVVREGKNRLTMLRKNLDKYAQQKGMPVCFRLPGNRQENH